MVHVPTAEAEGVAGREGRERERGGLEERRAKGAAHEPGDEGGRTGDERSAPRAEHDHRRKVDSGGDAEGSRPERLPHARGIRLLQQLRGQRGGAEQRERG